MPQVRFPGESREQHRARALHDRVEHLRDARHRILEAADAERRRIERDLHDGAQQRMVAVAVTLGLAEAQLATDPEGAARLLAQARVEAQMAVKELRELARGIHPALLSERGLGAALEALARRAPVPVSVSPLPAVEIRRPVESAAYFITAEALTNIAKHACASRASVQLTITGNRLCVEVSDDGVGGADGAIETGLSGLRDRVDALDGSLEVSSPPGVGTTLTVELPL